ncbi:DNA polymerase Y family protein [Kitasatospora sp. NPDC002040]|uniref:DNA polymerase Y family protein n=1 Tax=Kitasatospora sp. NPDC002040 TaxID=3154661 RepID=UPI00332E3278
MTTEEAGRTTPRVLVLWCPDWPVRAADPGSGDGQPVAVLEAGRVLAASAAARAAGVRRGQQLRLAQRLCPELRLRERQPAREAELFEPVVAAAEAFTPRVEVLRPGICVLPVKGPARYFGGEQALAEQVHAAALGAVGGSGNGSGSDNGYGVRIGIADGLFAATLAARSEAAATDRTDVLRPAPYGLVVQPGRTAAFLAPYPVAVLGDEVLAELLTRLGVRTVGAFAALSVRSVADRFGPTGTAAHRRSRGLHARPLAPRRAGPDLTVEQLFDPPEQLAEPLVFVARTLADLLYQRLGAIGLTCRRVAVEVTTADGRTYSRLWRHERRLGAAALAERVRWQLQAWQGMAVFEEGAGGFAALRLVPEALVPDQGRQLALWGENVAGDALERAVARVQAVVGQGGISRPRPAGGRGPGEWVARAVWGEEPPRPVAEPWPGRVAACLPFVVPAEPPQVAVLDAAGRPVTVSGRAEASAPPDRLRWAGRELEVTGWTGPWPAVEYWWDPARSRRRARLQVVAAGRALLLTVEDGHWQLEAEYG